MLLEPKKLPKTKPRLRDDNDVSGEKKARHVVKEKYSSLYFCFKLPVGHSKVRKA